MADRVNPAGKDKKGVFFAKNKKFMKNGTGRERWTDERNDGEKPVMRDGAGKSVMRKSGEKPAIKDGAEKPMMRKSGEKPAIKDGAGKPVMRKSGEKPAIKDGAGKPAMRNSGEKPVVKNVSGGLSCPVSRMCGGCSFTDCSYSAQLAVKEGKVRELLKGICPVMPITGMENPYYYRNKIHATFQYRKGGEIVSGIYQEGTHRVVKVDSCRIEDQTADAIIGTIRSLLKSFKVKIYDEDTGFGLLRHVMIRRGFSTGEVMVVLVCASPVFPSKNNFVKALREKHPEITTIVLNVNDKHTSMVLGERNIVLYGKGFIEDRLCQLTFRISPNSFYQVNPVQTEFLYGKAIALAGLTGKERVIDAYCGIGTIGLIASANAGEVIGVELNRDAVRDAVLNAKRNGITNVNFVNGDAGEWMVESAARGLTADVVLMDPPRSGSTEAFMKSAVQMKPQRIVYVSCNPETLVRDLKVLKRLGYQAEAAYPYDMFCWCDHVETVCLLERLSN